MLDPTCLAPLAFQAARFQPTFRRTLDLALLAAMGVLPLALRRKFSLGNVFSRLILSRLLSID